MIRTPVTDRYDAIIDLEPRPPGEIPRYAYALVKLTYEVRDGRTVLGKPEPLRFDVYRDPTLVPRLPQGSDFWVYKRATDVVVRGSAYMAGGKPGPSMEVAVRVGPLVKRIAVHGRREIVWAANGRIEIRDPEPFVEMPIVYQNAYGGLDPRVPIPQADREQFDKLAALGLAFDHPGLYPRNPIGKGYLVYPDPPMKGFEMPNLENPDEPLTARRLLAQAPELWYQQPLPWCFDWTNGLTYPRELFAGMDAWFPCPDPKRLPEVTRGFLPEQLLPAPSGRGRGPAVPSPGPSPDEPAAEFYQEASLGLVVRGRLAGQPITVTGMHPELRALTFTLPAEPVIEIEVERQKVAAMPLLTNLVIHPAEKKFYVVYFARTPDLARAFIPEVHKEIPISVSVANDPPIRYQPPPTVRERLAAAGAAE